MYHVVIEPSHFSKTVTFLNILFIKLISKIIWRKTFNLQTLRMFEVIVSFKVFYVKYSFSGGSTFQVSASILLVKYRVVAPLYRVGTPPFPPGSAHVFDQDLLKFSCHSWFHSLQALMLPLTHTNINVKTPVSSCVLRIAIPTTLDHVSGLMTCVITCPNMLRVINLYVVLGKFLLCSLLQITVGANSLFYQWKNSLSLSKVNLLHASN